MIVKSKAGEKLSEVSQHGEDHAEGYTSSAIRKLDAKKKNSPLASSRHGGPSFPRGVLTLHSNADGTKEIPTWRIWMQIGPSIKHIRHGTTFHTEPYKKKGSRRRAQNKFFTPVEGVNTSEPIADHKVEGEDVHLSTVVPLCTRWRKVPPQERKTIRQTTNDLEIQSANDIVRTTKEARVHPGVRRSPLREVGGGFAFAVVPGTIVR